MGYLSKWWFAFRALRATNYEALNSYIARLVRECRLSPETSTGIAVQKAETKAAPKVTSGAGPSRWALIRLLYRQYRQLQSRSAQDSGGRVAVAIATRRLPLSGSDSVRFRLREFTQNLAARASENRLAREFLHDNTLLIFEPTLVSPLWSNPERCWKDDVFIVDYAFLIFMNLCSPISTVRHMMIRGADLFSAFQIGTGAGGGGGLRGAAVAVFFAASYDRLLSEAKSIKALILTGNSFATEILRAALIHAPGCNRICEVLHGVPTLELNEYLIAVSRDAPEGLKHAFVPPLPDLALFGAYSHGSDGPDPLVVNTALNRYASGRCATGSEPYAWFSQECQRLFGAESSQTLIVALAGATSYDEDYLTSDSFLVERQMMLVAIETLAKLGRSFVMLYTPHPARGIEVFQDDPFFAQNKIVLYPDTMFTWLVADVSMGLHSSALFEAAYAGARVFAPIQAEDRLYPETILSALGRPNSGEAFEYALARFLTEQPIQTTEDLLTRVHERAERLFGRLSAWDHESRRCASA